MRANDYERRRKDRHEDGSGTDLPSALPPDSELCCRVCISCASRGWRTPPTEDGDVTDEPGEPWPNPLCNDCGMPTSSDRGNPSRFFPSENPRVSSNSPTHLSECDESVDSFDVCFNNGGCSRSVDAESDSGTPTSSDRANPVRFCSAIGVATTRVNLITSHSPHIVFISLDKV